MEQQITQIEVIPNNSLDLILKAEIDIAISTARAFPRSIKTFLERAESIATVSEDVAQSCNYAVPRGGKILEGATIRLAEIVCSTYGNIRSGARIIANDGKTITAQGVCHDLETNNCITVEVKRRITGQSGKTFSDDMQVVTGNAACAVALRNAIFKVVPFALVSEIYNKTKQVARGTAETLPARRDKAIAYLESLGVTKAQILSVLELKKIEDIDLDKLSVLRGMVTLINNGENTVKDLFEPETKEEISHEMLSKKFNEKKDSLNEDDMLAGERILEKKEVKSYSKLLKILETK